MEEMELVKRLRDRIVTALHVGRVRPGDRLPALRAVAHELGANPRTVAKAYRRLAEEGLVEVRGQSGVYAARQDHWGGALLVETGRWLGGVLFEAWKRNIPVPDLADLSRKCTTRGMLHAACVDETEDELRAICSDLETAFGFECSPISSAELPRSATEGGAVLDVLQRADLIVTTQYVARIVRPFAEALGTPMVTISLHPEIVRPVDRKLAEGTLTVVCVDPAFGEKLRAQQVEGMRERIRVIPVDDSRALESLDGREPVLLTHAARERLGQRAPTALVPFAPFISPESAAEITELMVRLHMQKEHSTHGG